MQPAFNLLIRDRARSITRRIGPRQPSSESLARFGCNHAVTHPSIIRSRWGGEGRCRSKCRPKHSHQIAKTVYMLFEYLDTCKGGLSVIL